MLYNLHISVTRVERKFVPLSKSKVLGAPWRGMISSVRRLAIVAASILGMAKISGHFVRYSVKTTMYLSRSHMTSGGPKQLTAKWSEAITGIRSRSARSLLRGFSVTHNPYRTSPNGPHCCSCPSSKNGSYSFS